MSTTLNWNEGYLKVFHDLFLSQPFNSSLFAKMITSCWQIWKARNDNVFRNVNPNPQSVVAASAATMGIVRSTEEQAERVFSQNKQTTIRWTTPSACAVKLNFDGSVNGTSAAGGFVIRDVHGRPLIAATEQVGTTTVPLAEAIALRNGLVCALERGHNRIEVEGDSKLVIDAVNKVVHPPWRLLKIIQDIQAIATRFNSISFRHIFREANFVADALANLGHNCTSGNVWTNRVPMQASRALMFDFVNSGCQRGFLL
ncbi:hypothetical protein ABKV19_002615 [Rosa sericea]